MGDVTTDAVLAVERALSEADRQRILAKFQNTNLNGAAVADILDILDNHDALLELREPFYDGGTGSGYAEVMSEFPPGDLPRRVVGFCVLAVALLTGHVPTAGPVSRMAHRALEREVKGDG